MSLKNVHLLFVIAAIALAVFCAVQAFGQFRADGSALMAGAVCLASAVALLLVRYEMAFMRRCREAGIR